jgi:hypothetical protein
MSESELTEFSFVLNIRVYILYAHKLLNPVKTTKKQKLNIARANGYDITKQSNDTQ